MAMNWDAYFGGSAPTPTASAPQMDWDSYFGGGKPAEAPAAPAPAPEPSWSETFATAKKNLPSTKDFLLSNVPVSMGGTFDAVRDVKNVGKLALGTAEYLAGADRGSQISNERDVADAFGHRMGNYFSQRGLKENISQDPLGTATDVLSLALPAKVGTLGERAIAKADEIGAQSLKSRAGDVIESAKNSGVHFTQPFMQELDNRLRTIAEENNYRPGKHDLTKAVLKQSDLMSEGLPSFRAMHGLRQDIGDALGSRLASERNIAGRMQAELDGVFTGLENGTPEQIAQVVHPTPGVDPAEVGQRFKAGLSAYSAAKRLDEVDRILEKAGNSAFNWTQSGASNAIMTKFRQLANNDKQWRMLSQEEKALVNDIVRGNGVDKLLTFASKFAIKGPVSAMATAAAHSIGGPVGAAITAGGGQIAKAIVERRMATKVERLQHHVLEKGESALRNAVGDAVYEHLNNTPSGQAVITNWLKARGGKSATRALAFAIAQGTQRTDLYPRIRDELSKLEGF